MWSYHIGDSEWQLLLLATRRRLQSLYVGGTAGHQGHGSNGNLEHPGDSRVQEREEVVCIMH
jgi:hypothetical protein